MTQGKLTDKQKQIYRIIGTSVEDAKSSMQFIQDAVLLKYCIVAEKIGSNRACMIKNINSRIRQIEREKK